MTAPASPTDEAEAQLRRMASLLAALSRTMAEQSEFHASSATAFAIETIQQAVGMAERRIGRVRSAGPRMRREMARTLLVELIRARRTAEVVLAEAAAEEWPDLGRAAEAALEEMRAVAAREPGLFVPGDCEPGALAFRPEAPFAAPPGWREIGHDSYAAVGPNGIPVSVLALGVEGDSRWAAQVGGVAVAFLPDAAAAAQAAVDVSAAWFGP